DVWDPAAMRVAQQFGPNAAPAFLAVLTNPPPPPPDFDGITWTYRVQIASAIVLSHLGPWESGPDRAALWSMISGPSDWLTIAGIVGFAWRAGDNPTLRAEVDGAFRWLRGCIAQQGFTPWEHALVSAWLAMGG